MEKQTWYTYTTEYYSATDEVLIHATMRMKRIILFSSVMSYPKGP